MKYRFFTNDVTPDGYSAYEQGTFKSETDALDHAESIARNRKCKVVYIPLETGWQKHYFITGSNKSSSGLKLIKEGRIFEVVWPPPSL